MNILFLCLGTFIFLVTALDIIKTTLSTMGGGKLTNFITKRVWLIYFSASGKDGKSKLLSYAGPTILVSILLTWIIGLWSGLFLVLLSDADSIVNSQTKASASALEKLYYAGFTLSTLGIGDYIASNNTWRIVTGVAAFSGLAFITASITYFVPVLSAVGLQSKLSLYINSMGKSPQQILTNSWNGKSFSSFFDNTSDLCQMLMQHTMNHHSYPVIHYFHNSKPQHSIAPALVKLDETSKLLQHGIAGEEAINRLKLNMLQTTIDAFLDMVQGSFLRDTSTKEAAPTPNLLQLREGDMPLREQDETAQTFNTTLQERRKVLTALLEMDGWSWNDVYSS
ncbi:potassium channel family protein [Pontibacter korlensis]|uniref:Potassium channel domain-containing protein n=1 Tax=Pontibacter korlensis TaxID=400092 RepID=A0A0E3ZJ62_9BACT|nr:potassium channel family protein [Pontibacter korlensis]AKD05030.1 hypothetical protein PKOR_20570 [Pontibacter korlensis]